MNVQRVIAELLQKYPGKNIVKNNSLDPTEIICEIDPAQLHPEYSTAIAVIDSTAPHFHRVTTESFTVLYGKLTLQIEDSIITLHENESAQIPPGAIHSAIGRETWVRVEAKPGWRYEDHIIAE